MTAGYGKSIFKCQQITIALFFLFTFRGERILTVNCLGDSVLTFTKHEPLHEKQYNIDLISEYESSLIGKLETVPDNIVIRIPMPE